MPLALPRRLSCSAGFPLFMSFLVLAFLALLLWWFPLWVFRAPKSRLGNFDQRGWPQGRNLALSVADVVRAAVGAALLIKAVAGAGLRPWEGCGALAGALAVALVVQTWAWHDEDYLQAPVAFVLGALVPFAHPLLLAISLPAAVGGALAFRGWSGAFLCGGAVFAGVGFLLPAQDWRISLLVGAVVNLPVFLPVAAGRHLGGVRR